MHALQLNSGRPGVNTALRQFCGPVRCPPASSSSREEKRERPFELCVWISTQGAKQNMPKSESDP